MSKQVKIEVTREDIDNAVPRSPFKCMLALAISRIMELGASGSVYVNPFTRYARFKKDQHHTRVELPAEACKLAIDFDAMRTVSPFEFEMKIME